MGLFSWAGDLWDDWTGKSQSDANISFQQKENRIARSREDNAVQRRVHDLEAAGMNPVLAAGQPAASAPMKAPESSYKPETPEKIMQMMTMKKNIAVAAAQKKLLDSQANKTDAEADAIKGKTPLEIEGLTRDNALKLITYKNTNLDSKIKELDITNKEIKNGIDILKSKGYLKDLSIKDAEIEMKNLLINASKISNEEAQRQLDLMKETGMIVKASDKMNLVLGALEMRKQGVKARKEEWKKGDRGATRSW